MGKDEKAEEKSGGIKGMLAEHVTEGAKKGEDLGLKSLLGTQIKDDSKKSDRSESVREVLQCDEAETGLSTEIRRVLTPGGASSALGSLDGSPTLQVFFLGAGDQLDFRPAEGWKATWETPSMVYEVTAEKEASICLRRADGKEESFEATAGMRLRVCGSTVFLELAAG